MSTIKTKIGEALKIILEDYDGRSVLYPQAILRDAAGVLLPESPVYLAHVGEGLYENTAVAMPSTAFVTAVIIPYIDAGHTEVSDDNQHGLTVFLRDDILIAQRGVAVVERLEGTLRQSTRLEACLADAEMRGLFSMVRLTGKVARPTVQGVLYQTKLTGLVRECC